MRIIAKGLTGKMVQLEVESTTTIEEVKRTLSETDRFGTPSLRLIYSGKALENDKTIGDYGIKEDDTIIHVIMLLN